MNIAGKRAVEVVLMRWRRWRARQEASLLPDGHLVPGLFQVYRESDASRLATLRSVHRRIFAPVLHTSWT